MIERGEKVRGLRRLLHPFTPSPFHPFTRSAFTLIEVVVAMAVLATISTGLLATTWALVRFARDEAEHMVADAYCHDVMWAVYSQFYTNMVTDLAFFPLDPVTQLPRIESVDLFGNEKVTYPLWRSQDQNLRPQCAVRVVENAEKTEKTITVTVKWHDGSGWAYHSNVVTRARIERGGGR